MKVVCDNIIFSLQKIGGISIYWSELLKRLTKEHFDISFIESNNDNIVKVNFPSDKVAISYLNGFPIILSRFFNPQLKDIKKKFIFHSSYNRFTNNPYALKVVTVHDFVHERYYFGLRKWIHSYQKRKAILAADAIIVISESTKRDLLSYFPKIDSQKVKLIYNGVSDIFHPIVSSTACPSLNSYLLFIGSREKYKNFNFSVELIAQLPSFYLQIVGSELTAQELRLLDSLIPGRWNHSSYVSNTDLNIIYNNAFALLYPSAYEGFGIPILEAMKTGCPFIALNYSSIPEVAGDAGILLDHLDIDLAKRAVELISLQRDEIVAKGFDQAKKFSWDKCYLETVALYNKLYEG